MAKDKKLDEAAKAVAAAVEQLVLPFKDKPNLDQTQLHSKVYEVALQLYHSTRESTPVSFSNLWMSRSVSGDQGSPDLVPPPLKLVSDEKPEEKKAD